MLLNQLDSLSHQLGDPNTHDGHAMQAHDHPVLLPGMTI